MWYLICWWLCWENHPDMHFRQNCKANQNMGCGHSCGWFVTLEVYNIFDLAYCFCWHYHRIEHRTPYQTLRERVMQLCADGWHPMNVKATAATELAKCNAKLWALYADLHWPWLETLCTLIQTSTSSMTSIPNPTVHYTIIFSLLNSSHTILL